MILVLGGTYDSRKLTEALLGQGCAVLYSSVTAYNTGSLPENARLEIHTGALETDGLAGLMAEKRIELCVDATHPYAKEVSLNAIAASKKAGAAYVRLERPRMMDDGQQTLGFPDYESAVRYLLEQEGNVLLTTGSRQLEFYDPLPKERVIVRVLPTSRVLEKCERLGYKPQNIIAMQGPFSYAMNVETIRQFDIRFLVTKDSGDVGGVSEKLRAAADMGVRVIFIERPRIEYPVVFNTAEEILGWMAENK